MKQSTLEFFYENEMQSIQRFSFFVSADGVLFSPPSSMMNLTHLLVLRVKVYTQADGKVCIHPKSVNAEETEFNYTWLIYHLKMRTSSVSRRGGRRERIVLRECWSVRCCVCLFVCVWFFFCICPSEGCTSGKKDQRLKVGNGATPALHWMNIWLKHCLSTRSQRLLCFKASRNKRRGGGGGKRVGVRVCVCLGGGKMVNAALSPLFPSLHTPISLPSICLCSSSAVCLCEWYQKKTPFMFFLITAPTFVSHSASFVFYEGKCFAGFHHC